MKGEAEFWQARMRHARWTAEPRIHPVRPPARPRRNAARAAQLKAAPIPEVYTAVEDALELNEEAPDRHAVRPLAARLSRLDIFAAIALAGGSAGMALGNFAGGIVMLSIATILAVLPGRR